MLCAFVFDTDLRRPQEELYDISAVALPQFGLCPDAVSLYHRPGGHVFPGHGPVLLG